jgi:hypothetical protein
MVDLHKVRVWGRRAGKVMTVAHVVDVGATAGVLAADFATRPDEYRRNGQFARNMYRAWMDDGPDDCDDPDNYCDGCDDYDCDDCNPLEEYVDPTPEDACGHCGWVHQDDDPCIIDTREAEDDPAPRDP